MPDVVAKAMAVITGLLLLMTIGDPRRDLAAVVGQAPDRRGVPRRLPGARGHAGPHVGAAAGSTGQDHRHRRRARVDHAARRQGRPGAARRRDRDDPPARQHGRQLHRLRPRQGGRSRCKERDGKLAIACDAPQPTAPCTNTLAAPRLDDLINAFGPPEQAGVKLILEELSPRGRPARRRRQPGRPAACARPRRRQPRAARGQRAEPRAQEHDRPARSGRQARAPRVASSSAALIGSLEQTLSATAAATGPLDAGLAAPARHAARACARRWRA